MQEVTEGFPLERVPASLRYWLVDSGQPFRLWVRFDAFRFQRFLPERVVSGVCYPWLSSL
ncbi:MAG: hypothetical protein ABIZ04_21585 [Opitutus sp.]